eukprot:4984773-Lingulodinium_polyedra.AAC.1
MQNRPTANPPGGPARANPMESQPVAPHPRFCDVCGFCVRADAFDDHVKGKKHRLKVKNEKGP